METQPAAPYGSLAQSARSSELKKAKGILWFVGILTILVNGFMFFTAESQIDKEIDKELRKHGGSLEEVRSLPAEARATFDAERTKALNQAKLGLGGGTVLGILFIACALAVNRKPVAATVAGLVLYLGGTAVFAAMEPESLARGLIIKIFIIIGLISSVKAALAVEKQDRAADPA
jgi:hypothetical protein